MFSISHEKLTLSNGLDVILHEDHSLPVVAVNVWYHVGSKDEEPGHTGFAHLFEHVMFEGSKHHDKSYFEPLQKVGANLNGSTTSDRTNYWENVPSNYLELALWLEADRMGFLLDALDEQRFDVQRDVVKNERRQTYENRPYGMAYLMLQPALFPAPHPYSWTPIGSPEDLDNATLEDVKAFFRRYYAPSNASVAIAGDFAPDEVVRLVERYFGDIPPGPPINRVGRMDSDLRGQVALTMRDKVQLPRLYLVWPTGPLFGEDQAALDVLATVLGDGKSSRLYRSLVYEKQIAQDVTVAQSSQEIAGEFFVQATASPGHTLEEIESVVREELARARLEPPGEKEIQRAKNRIESQHVLQLEHLGGFGGRADQLNYYNTMAGEPAVVNSDLERYMAVSATDVQHAATSLDDRFVKLSVVPETALVPSASSVDRSSIPAPATAPSFTPPIPLRSSLSNGLSIVCAEKPEMPTVALGFLLRGGAVADPPDTPGLAQMTASLLTEGTTNRSSQQIAEEMEFMGSHLASEATREYVLLSAEVLASHWVAALEIMADVAINANFPAEELERVRKERLTDLGRIADNPAVIASRASRALLYGPDSRYGHPASGTESSVQRITRDDLQAHFAEHYGPANACLIVAGAARSDEVVASAESLFGGWTARKAPPPGKPAEGELVPPGATTIFLTDKPGAAQSVIRAGLLTVTRLHPDFYALTLLNYIFGGQFSARLNMNLRQSKGYSYGYMSSIDWTRGPSALMAGGAVQTAVTKEAVAETLREFEEIRNGRPVTKDEYEAAMDGILRALPSQFETQAQALQQIVRQVVFGLPEDYYRALPGNLSAVSLDDVQRVAEERLDNGRLKVLVVGDGASIEPGLSELGLPVVAVDQDGRELKPS